MNSKKWLDLCFLITGIIAIFTAYFIYSDHMKTDLNSSMNVVVMGIVSEGDCVGCIEDVMCNWKKLKKKLSQVRPNISFKLYFGVLDK